jgi:hypothetical protein
MLTIVACYSTAAGVKVNNINRKERKELRKERKALNIRNFLFATFAKKLCVPCG